MDVRILQYTIFFLLFCVIYNILILCKNLEIFTNKKPYLWQYWDNIDNNSTPAYISLCLETVDRKCANSFEIIRLNKDNIEDYIPEIKNYKKELDNLIIAHKVDIYRIFLLYKYGGLYMDADIICLRDPIEIIDKLNEYDFVGFGCTGYICKYGYGKPSNWILASKPNGILISHVLTESLDTIKKHNNFKYHDLGKMIIWNQLDILIKDNNYSYYHYPNKIDGSRDMNGKWITSNIIFSNNDIKYDDEDNMMFLVIYNSEINNNIKILTRNELLNNNTNYSKFVKKGLL